MTLRHLRVDGLRCLSGLSLDLHERCNYLCGPNGSGKTSCLEAIYLLGRGRSFRTRQTTRLLRHGSDRMTVFGVTLDQDGQSHHLGVEFAGGRLESRLDGEPVLSQAEMLRTLPVFVIDPRLHQLVEAGPTERRRYLDNGVFHVEPGFLADWRHYRRVLGQRNAALKARVPDRELGIWTEPLIAAGQKVHEARGAYVLALAGLVAALGRTLVGADLRIVYRAGWRQGSSLAEALEESRVRDRLSGFTQVGPHRADLALDFESGGVRETASRGQQKLVAASLVLAQVKLFEDRTGRRGTLLLDDASAELDGGAQLRLASALEALMSQQVLTGLSLESLQPQPGFPVFHVEQGKIRSML
jgi:DNA replication and repair protein RecF